MVINLEATYKGYILNKEYDCSIKTIRKGKRAYVNSYICLDTETSHNHNEMNRESWVYQWAFTFNKGLYYGRRPDDLVEKLADIATSYELSDTRRLKVFIHNLAYDFSYLCMFLRDKFGDPNHILATSSHHIFQACYDCGLEFLCTYKLSNDSLDRWSRKVNTVHKKLVGSIDYDIVRFQDSKLNKNDWRYMFYDVIVMDEALTNQMDIYDENIANLQITSTGYVRKELRLAFKGKGRESKWNPNVKFFKQTRLSTKSYLAAHDEASGGITHGNRHKAGVTEFYTAEEPGRHGDFRSHYPTQPMVNDGPMGRLNKFSNEVRIEDLLPYRKSHWLLIEVTMSNIKLKKKGITLPYLQASHLIRRRTAGYDMVEDNGRVLSFTGQTRVWLHLEEFLIVLKQYSFSYKIHQSYGSVYGPYPEWLKDAIKHHFKLKSDLKDKVKALKKSSASRDDIMTAELDLMKSKNLLNGIYGVFMQDPVRVEYTLDGHEYIAEQLTEERIGEKLDAYYDSYSSFARYIWGCDIVMRARLELVEFVEAIGYDNYIYSDTDSIFYRETPEVKRRIEALNKKKLENAMTKGAYITTDKGDIVTFDVFEDEGEDIREFKFLHAKCYGYVTADGELHSTIAGVSKKGRRNTWREDELGSLDNLRAGFQFSACGGSMITYETESDIHYYKGNITAGGGIILNNTKTLSMEYQWDLIFQLGL